MPYQALAGSDLVAGNTMKTPHLILLCVVIACSSCRNEMKVTPAGPSVADQLKSRGYISTAADTTLPDTSRTVRGKVK